MSVSANYLVFDCSTPVLLVGVKSAQGVFEYSQALGPKQSEQILPFIHDLSSQAQMELSDLTAIGFGCGPGSFIGVRTATCVAQGLAYGLDIPVASISTLQTIAQTIYQDTNNQNITVAIDARKEELYWANYQLQDSIMQTEQEFLSVKEKMERAQDAFYFEDYVPKAAAMFNLLESVISKNKLQKALEVQPVYLRNNVVY